MTGNCDDASAETTGIASDVSFLDGATDCDDNAVGGEFTGAIGTTTCCNGSTRPIVAAWSDIDSCEGADSAGAVEVLSVSSDTGVIGDIGVIGAAIAGMSDRG